MEHEEEAEVARRGWHILRDGDTVTVARRAPVRWDVSAETCLPPARRLRIAMQVRQDVWRALRRQRGFSPVVRVAVRPAGLSVRAGGRVEGAYDRRWLEARIAAVLADPACRDRWMACARDGDRQGPRA